MILNDVEIEFDDDNIPEKEDIIKNLSFLFGTRTDTYPINRDFGIDSDILDQPLAVAETMLTVEYHAKVEQFEPRVEILDVTFSVNPDNGAVTPHIKVTTADMEEDEENEDEFIEEREDDVEDE